MPGCARLLVIVTVFLGLSSSASPPAMAAAPRPVDERLVDTVAFGSCADQNVDQPIWRAVVAVHPDVFVFLGDNVYGDTDDVDVLRSAYAKLGAKPGFQRLVASDAAVIATWDDH